MVHAHLVQDGGVEIVDVDGILDDVVSQLVGCTEAKPRPKNCKLTATVLPKGTIRSDAFHERGSGTGMAPL
jgi:hypothetical protein